MNPRRKSNSPRTAQRQKNPLSVQFMKPKFKWFQDRLFCAVALGIDSSFSPAAAAEDWAEPAPAKASIQWPACRGDAGRSEIGANAGADYPGAGLAVMPAAVGARVGCVFQKMEGEGTREGFWLELTGTKALQ